MTVYVSIDGPSGDMARYVSEGKTLRRTHEATFGSPIILSEETVWQMRIAPTDNLKSEHLVRPQ